MVKKKKTAEKEITQEEQQKMEQEFPQGDGDPLTGSQQTESTGKKNPDEPMMNEEFRLLEEIANLQDSTGSGCIAIALSLAFP
ncbi:MAG: hypothetical protein R6V49_05450, partial [Bacteroidales bacterium]